MSKHCKTSSLGEWIVEIKVIPYLLKFHKFDIISNAVDESNPVVGSSKNNKLGSETNSIPIETRFFSPPDIPQT